MSLTIEELCEKMEAWWVLSMTEITTYLCLLKDQPQPAGSFCAFWTINGLWEIQSQGWQWTITKEPWDWDYCITLAQEQENDCFPILLTVYEEKDTRDSIEVHPYNQTTNSFCIHISEWDNWTAANVLRDRKFYFAIPCWDPVWVTIAWPQWDPGPQWPQWVQWIQWIPWDLSQLDTEEVDDTDIIVSQLSNVDIHNNWNQVQFAWDSRIDTWWSRSTNIVTYTWSPDIVEWLVEINAEDEWASNYRARTKIRVIKWWNIIAVIDDLVMQQTWAYDWDATLNWSFVDEDPWNNPSYTFEWFDEDNRTATLIPNEFSNITLQARNKVSVVKSQ